MTTMTPSATAYVDSLQLELGLLDRLLEVAQAQHRAAGPKREGDLGALVLQRQDLEDALVVMSERRLQLRPQPNTDAMAADEPRINELNRRARTTIGRIMDLDRETLAWLTDGRAARHAQVTELDTGEATLAAYRRAVSLVAGPAELVHRIA